MWLETGPYCQQTGLSRCLYIINSIRFFFHPQYTYHINTQTTKTFHKTHSKNSNKTPKSDQNENPTRRTSTPNTNNHLWHTHTPINQPARLTDRPLSEKEPRFVTAQLERATMAEDVLADASTSTNRK